MFIKNLIIFVAILQAIFLQAQVHYVPANLVNSQGNVLKGRLILQAGSNMGDSVVFLSQNAKTPQTFFPEDIAYVQSHRGKSYRSVSTFKDKESQPKQKILEELIVGKLSFYKHPNPVDDSLQLYAGLSPDRVYWLDEQDFQYVITLDQLSIACHEPVACDELKYTIESIGNAIAYYNHHMDISERYPQEKPITYYKSLNYGFAIVPLDQYHFNHEEEITDTTHQVNDMLNRVDLRVELKNKFASKVRIGVQAQYIWGFREANFTSGLTDFENRLRSFGACLRTSYVYPGNGKLNLLLSSGLGVRRDHNLITYKNGIRFGLEESFARWGADLLLAVGLRLEGTYSFTQVEMAYQRIPILSVGVGIK